MPDLTILKLQDQGSLLELQTYIKWCFRDRTWLDLSAIAFQDVVASAQDTLNTAGFVKRIAHDLKDGLTNLLGSEDMMVQSNLYLRAARPTTGEAVGWHRESMYGCQPEAWNVWMPVLNCTPENSIQYVPGSAEIPDDEIKTEQEACGGVKKGSSGHKIGLLYAPKRITDGVDFTTARPMGVPLGSAAAFSSRLVHGAARNQSETVRYSVDFRVIAKEHVGRQKQHFSSGKDFFIPLEAA